MNKRWFVPIIALFFIGLFSVATMGMEAFKIDQYVTDQAGLLSQGEQVQLSEVLYRYAESTGNQILVVTISSLEGEELAGFTEKLFELNKPGAKGKDNGIILLVAKEERKIRIEVGYGLEEAVPDGRAGTIIREVISPRFQNGDFLGGIAGGVFSIIKSISPDYNIEGYQGTSVRVDKGNSFPAAFLVALIIVIFSFISSFRSNQTYRRRYRRGYSETNYWGDGGFGGGFFGGGGGFGGGSSGGGFSGGGGSFGGGGASGGW
jgi:uncharacterized protein